MRYKVICRFYNRRYHYSDYNEGLLKEFFCEYVEPYIREQSLHIEINRNIYLDMRVSDAHKNDALLCFNNILFDYLLQLRQQFDIRQFRYKYLHSLSITNFCLEDKVVEALCQHMLDLPFIAHLNLSRNKLRNASGLALAKLLRNDCKNLKSVDLSMNLIQTVGFSAIAESLLYFNSTIYSFKICQNSLVSGSLPSIRNLIEHNSSLVQFHCNSIWLGEANAKKIGLFIQKRYEMGGTFCDYDFPDATSPNVENVDDVNVYCSNVTSIFNSQFMDERKTRMENIIVIRRKGEYIDINYTSPPPYPSYPYNYYPCAFPDGKLEIHLKTIVATRPARISPSTMIFADIDAKEFSSFFENHYSAPQNDCKNVPISIICHSIPNVFGYLIKCLERVNLTKRITSLKIFNCNVTSNFSSNQNQQCKRCGDAAFLKCSRCQNNYDCYCSKECFKKDYLYYHKTKCIDKNQ